ncbi:DUF1189 family protein [Streptococcus plurextorum]|uniref:DUF1189 family protein n=1 Tax=Streptococcus plurextorum TaxID=456876 RepID=UPI00041F3674|nr:DUF1189 family protein [Streptococcus plurextorum]
MKVPFPFSYFGHMIKPRKIFDGRNSYKWWQVLVLVIFLNSLILFPVSLHYAKLETYDMERIVTRGLASVTNETYHTLQEGSIEDGRFTGTSQFSETEESLIAVLPSKELEEVALKNGKYVLLLKEDRWLFSYPDGQVLEAPLSGNKALSTLKTAKDVRAFVNNQWFSSHKPLVFLFLMMVYTALLYVGTLLLLGAGSLTLYVTRKAKIFDLRTFGECLGLLVNCMGLPSLLALVAAGMGLVDNPILLMNIQVFGTLLVLMLVLYRTGFRDKK